MKTVFPVGTTLYEPDACANGYTLVSGSGVVRLVTMNGEPAHEWRVGGDGPMGFIHRARLQPNGSLMILVGPAQGRPGHLEEYDWDGRLTWEYTPEAGDPHHDFWPRDDGGVLLICKEPVPPEVTSGITDEARRGLTIYGDVLIEVSREKEVTWLWHQHEHLDINTCNPIPAAREWRGGPDNNTITDWTHTNTIQALPGNKHFDAGDVRFRPGNVLISMRQLDTILIVDRETHEVAWSYTGDYKGGMSGQHESNMIGKGAPGEGNILVFDNGASPHRDLAHAGCSFVLEIDPTTKDVAWVYDVGHRFHSPFTSNCQRLTNGNTLIFEAACRRMFEVKPDKKIVWEYVTTDNAQRVHRYPYDHCAQTQALAPPRHLRVTPPKEIRIEPESD